MMPAERIASKFLKLIRRITGDNELNENSAKKITIDTITYFIHENMYDQLNPLNSSNDGRNVIHLQKRLKNPVTICL